MTPPEPATTPGDRPALTLAHLKRWEDNGALWRALEITDTRAVVELTTCSGEPVDVLEGTEPALIAFVRSHPGER